MSLLLLLAAASVTVAERTMTTYPFTDPDPVPCVGEKRYPYCRFDGSSETGEAKAWKVVTLENGLIRVTLTPEIGGKVWGAKDLRTGVDFIYDNHVVKFRDVAARGPWTSGGIEFNFGIVGHAPSCSTPVDWFVRTNADSSVSCFVASEEYVTRSRWQVEVRLRPGAEEFETHTTWYNASGLPQPYYHWMNAAYSLRGNPRFLFPGSQYIGHSGDAHPWPVDEEGRDLSVYGNNAFGSHKSYHVLPGPNDAYGIWWPEKGVGAYHRNEPCEKYGRKIWLWALSRAGGIWEDLLTDDDGQYAELQSGRCFQQPGGESVDTPFDHPLFRPGSTECFSERWGVLRDPAALSDNPSEPAATGRPTVAPADFDRDSARGRYLRGRHCFSDRGNSYAEAEMWFRKALEKDPWFRPAQVALAALEVRRGNYAACHALCGKVLSLDTYDTDANYLDGFAYFAEGDDANARDRLGVAAFDARNRAAAYALVARTYLRSGKGEKALLFVEKALAANAASLDALLVKAVALRGTAAFASFADETLAKYPLFHAVRYLRDGVVFRSLVRNELPNQTFLEMGSWFEASGLRREAAELFALAADDPIAVIRRAFLLGDARGLDAAARLPVAGVSPFRRESLPALAWAAEKGAGWKFRYLYAVALAALDRGDEADGLLATLDCADDPVVFLFRAARRSGEAKLKDLRRARQLGDSWRIGRQICAHFEAAKDNAAFLREAADYLKRYPKNNAIQSAYAKALCANGKYRDCLEFLKTVVFLPSELRGNVSETWREAQRALGLEVTYPENLGSGKPYPPEGIRPERAVIVLPERPTEVERSAAGELADGVFRMTGVRPRTVGEDEASDGVRFFVGATRAARKVAPDAWKYDEVLVAPVRDGVVCAGHPERGPIYAVDTYLERVCGVRWWTSTESRYPRLAKLPRPDKAIRHAPVFAYRETYFMDGYTSALFKVRSKGNFSSRTRYMYHPLEPVPPALGGDHRLFYYEGRGSAYHSYFEVLPPKVHFKDHPEWYSLVDGRRQPLQLCLTNPEVKRAYVEETLRLLESDPGVDFVSVSQNDWDGACRCTNCQAVIDEEGAISGLTLRFANEVAEAIEKRFPKVMVDTFAYRFTVEPPRKARPRHNVTVRLCCIDSGFNEPLSTRHLDLGFTDQLARWAELAAGRLYIWDYVVNFHQYMLPHPNVRVLAPNIRLFADAKATGVLSLGDALCSAGSLAAFKHWYVAQLLWDPYADADALRDDFLNGYYGKAASALREYIDVFEDAGTRLAAQDVRLRYAYKNYCNGFVTAAEGCRARAALDRAAQVAASEGPDFARRVARERVGLDLAFILNHDAWDPGADLAAAVEKWIADCGRFNVEAHWETVDKGDLATFFDELRKKRAEGGL